MSKFKNLIESDSGGLKVGDKVKPLHDNSGEGIIREIKYIVKFPSGKVKSYSEGEIYNSGD
jgi:hypothetical protein